MKKIGFAGRGIASMCLASLLLLGAGGATYHVSPAGDGTTGASWATAFKTIAPGVAAAAAGDTVLVGAGTYAITAAVTLTNAISLIGVDGPSATTIQANNCRGVHVTATGAGALVAGFTVTGGNAAYNKGANIYLQGAGTVSNCVAKACQAWQWANGGGIAADAGLVTHCVVHGNRVDNRSGAGVWLGGSSVLANSLVYGNTNKVNNASYSGGGVYAQDSSVVRNCAVVRNAAVLGGGVSQIGNAQVVNTVVSENRLYEGTTLNNLAFANGSAFSHCCAQPTNGLSGAGNTDLSANLDWGDPLFRPKLGSACIDAGLNDDWMTNATDLAGSARVINGTVDIGALEFVEPAALTCGFTVSPASGVGSVLVSLAAAVAGPGQTGLVYSWDFENDGVYDASGAGLATTTHLYGGGIHSIKLRVANDQSAVAESVQIGAVNVSATETYVVPSNPNAAYPYASWATAAASIQTASDAVVPGGTVWVTNGFYKLASTLLVAKPVAIRSVNGRDVTTISGDKKVRAVNLQHASAVIDGFTIRDGKIDYQLGQNLYLQPGTARNCRITACVPNYAQGGGVCAVDGHLVNCIVDGNAVIGQGPAGVDLRNASSMTGCLVYANTNSAGANPGGGVRAQNAPVVIRNCTIVDNWTLDGGEGAGLHLDQAASVINCVIASNGVHGASGVYTNNVKGATANMSYTCAWPLTFDASALTEVAAFEPQFRAYSQRDYRLSRFSPCRDVGLHQDWMDAAVDLDGSARASTARRSSTSAPTSIRTSRRRRCCFCSDAPVCLLSRIAGRYHKTALEIHQAMLENEMQRNIILSWHPDGMSGGESSCKT